MLEAIVRYHRWIFHGLNGVGAVLHLAGMVWMARNIGSILDPITVWVTAPALILALLGIRAWGRLFSLVLLWGATIVCLSGVYLISFLLFGQRDAQDALILLVLPFIQGLVIFTGAVLIHIVAWLSSRRKRS